MRHAHDLGGFTELTQHLAHDGGRRPADAHVHLVKDQRRRVHFAGGYDLYRQRDAGQLAAGGHFRQRL